MAKRASPARAPAKPAPVLFDVWGCRGSRSIVPGLSRVGSHTSCYSLFDGETIVVIDAGRGLTRLASALGRERRFRGLRAVRIFVTHAHMDHWEGLKDADWFWEKGNGLDVSIFGPPEALKAIERAHQHPAYVPLDRLALGTLAGFEVEAVSFRAPRRFGAWTVEAWPLHHYSGAGSTRNFLETAGWRIMRDGGPTVVYISDHEPTAATAPGEAAMTGGAHLAVYDASYAAIRDHAYGHGSQEYAASVARARPEMLVLAAHHGPWSTDTLIRAAFRKYGKGLPNYRMAVEAESWVWDEKKGRFRRVDGLFRPGR